MNVRHDEKELESIETDDGFNGGYDAAIASKFRRILNLVRNVQNETELYHWKGLRLEKLKGKRKHQYSMRINDQWRVIVEFEGRSGSNNNVCVVKEIDDYH